MYSRLAHEVEKQELNLYALGKHTDIFDLYKFCTAIAIGC